MIMAGGIEGADAALIDLPNFDEEHKMLTKALLSAVLLVGVSAIALAQTSTTPSTTTSPSATTGTTASKSTQHMTEAQVKQKLQQEGYSDVQLKRSALSGSTTGTTGSSTSSGTSGSSSLNAGNEMWTGTAMKGGKKVNIEVDSMGKVTQR